ncbi:MAG: hypothetical protein HQ574_06505 [Chloroflexi bacterium]|nr:hypothetical protein [Chloroflexota bacterium]
MKKSIFLIAMIGIAGLLVSCSSTPDMTAIQATEGKLTFAFFYTDG